MNLSSQNLKILFKRVLCLSRSNRNTPLFEAVKIQKLQTLMVPTHFHDAADDKVK